MTNMIHPELRAYVATCIALTRSVYIHSTTVAKQTLHFFQTDPNYRQYNITCTSRYDHPYYLHLMGESMLGIEEDIIIHSLDTDTDIILTPLTLVDHPKTRASLIQNKDFFYKAVSAIGDMGHQRLMGILYPITKVESLYDGQILYYDSSLVESSEYSLISELQTWIVTTLHRWTNSGYIATGRLYASALMGILYVNMVGAIMNIRDSKCKTPEVHTFYIDRWLSDYGIGDYLQNIPTAIKYRIYRNIEHLDYLKGSQKALEWWQDLLFADTVLQLRTYRHAPLYGASDYPITVVESTNGVPTRHLNAKAFSELLTDMDIPTGEVDVWNAWTYGQHLDMAGQVTVSTRSTAPLHWHSLEESMVHFWGWLSIQGNYQGSIQVTTEDDTVILMSIMDAFLYYWYSTHNTLTITLPGIPVVGSPCQPTVPSLLTIDTFPSVAEAMYQERELTSYLYQSEYGQNQTIIDIHTSYLTKTYVLDTSIDVWMRARNITPLVTKDKQQALINIATQYLFTNYYLQVSSRDDLTGILDKVGNYSTHTSIDNANDQHALQPPLFNLTEV